MSKKITKIYTGLLGGISGFLLLFFFAMIIGNVMCRQVFKISAVFFDELSTYSFMWMVFLSGAMAFMDESHYKVEILPPAFLEKHEVAFHYFETFINCVYAVLLLYFGMKFSNYNSSVKTLTLHMPIKYLSLCIPLSAILTIIAIALREVAFIEHRKEEKAEKEAKV